MLGLKLDFKKIGMSAAGNAVGLMAVTQINKISFIKNIQKPVTKGLVTLLLGKIAIPFIAQKAGLSGKKGGDFVDGVSEAVGVYGIGQILSNVDATKNLVPVISGYEDSVYLGAVYEDQPADQPAGMGNYEDNPVSGTDDVYGEAY